METKVIEVRTGIREAVVDLSAEITAFLRSVGAGRDVDGLLNVWVPHATAGVAVIETGAGSDTDLLTALRDLLPADDRWRHRHGSTGHGRDSPYPPRLLRRLPSPDMSCPRSWRPRRVSRCSPEHRRWARGSRSAWSTRTPTTPSVRCGCRSCGAESAL